MSQVERLDGIVLSLVSLTGCVLSLPLMVSGHTGIRKHFKRLARHLGPVRRQLMGLCIEVPSQAPMRRLTVKGDCHPLLSLLRSFPLRRSHADCLEKVFLMKLAGITRELAHYRQSRSYFDFKVMARYLTSGGSNSALASTHAAMPLQPSPVQLDSQERPLTEDRRGLET